MKTSPQLKRSYGKAKSILLILFLSAVSMQNLHAQGSYKLSASKDNAIKVLGSSNVHDWTMNAYGAVCEANFSAVNESSGVPASLRSFSFSVDAKSLKSEHKSMDNRTYTTIKANDYPKIAFKLTDASITPLQKGKFTVKATGNLTIAGVSEVIVLHVNGVVNPDNTITCSGEQKIKLTDFKIDPPSFLLGTMKVANDLTIQYSLNLTEAKTALTSK